LPEGLDLTGELADQARLGDSVIAEIAELSAIEFDRALDALGHRRTMLAAALIGRAGDIDEGKGLDHGRISAGSRWRCVLS
jgi:hypothetical protein